MSFSRYPSYKSGDAGLLKELPEHWSSVRTKQLIRSIESGVSVNSTDAPAAEGEFGVLKTSCVYGGAFDPAENKAVLLEEYDRLACPVTAGTLIVSRMNTPDLVGSVGLVRETQENLFLPDRLWKISFDDADAAYVHYWSLTPLYRAQVEAVCAGTSSSMQNLSQGDFCDFVLPLPSRTEQALISAFLDRETEKIDSLVEEQRRLLELLQEKRQVVISLAVTKGLNPDAPMKPSGIDWLGNIPTHWATPPLYMRYSSELGKMLDGSRITGTHLIPYVRNVDVQWGAINFENLPVMDIRQDEYRRYTLRTGDLLVCEGGEVGRASIVPPIDTVVGYQKALHRLRPRSGDENVKFLYYTFLWAANSGIFNLGGASTIAHLTGEQLRKYRFPRPPMVEQDDIVTFLEIETGKLDTLTAEAQRAISLLQERRNALISSIVTGQLDVRGLA